MAQTPPSQQLQAGVQVLNPFELETDLGPYATITEANTAIISAKRFIGKKIKIVVANVPTEYWWSGGIGDVNLIAISTGGSAGLTSFNGRTAAAAMPTAGDYNAFYGSIVTNAPTIALLENDANWTTNHYTGTAITNPQNAGDWYINENYDYKFRTASTVRRILYSATSPTPSSGLIYTLPFNL